MKYKKNLHIEGDKVLSYTTHVATIKGGQLIVHGYWSVTTSKHINHVAEVRGLTIVKGEKEPDGMLKSTAMVALFGNILCNTQKEKNDWKARMLKAGLGNRGLMMPDDWNTLSEDEKERRLNGAINQIK